jgi:hypothetical protein
MKKMTKRKDRYSHKDFDRDQKKMLKIQSGLDYQIKSDPKLKELVESKDPKTFIKEKLNALDLIIAYLIRKGKQDVLPVQTLIGIANDYEKMWENEDDE